MRTLALVAALMIGTAATAQDMPQQAQPGMQQQQDTMPPADPPANTGAAGPAAGAQEPSGQPMTPPADASAPMTQTTPPADAAAPMGATPPATGMQSGPGAAPSEYPLCSRTVKDRCRNRGGK